MHWNAPDRHVQLDGYNELQYVTIFIFNNFKKLMLQNKPKTLVHNLEYYMSENKLINYKIYTDETTIISIRFDIADRSHIDHSKQGGSVHIHNNTTGPSQVVYWSEIDKGRRNSLIRSLLYRLNLTYLVMVLRTIKLI